MAKHGDPKEHKHMMPSGRMMKDSEMGKDSHAKGNPGIPPAPGKKKPGRPGIPPMPSKKRRKG